MSVPVPSARQRVTMLVKVEQVGAAAGLQTLHWLRWVLHPFGQGMVLAAPLGWQVTRIVPHARGPGRAAAAIGVRVGRAHVDASIHAAGPARAATARAAAAAVNPAARAGVRSSVGDAAVVRRSDGWQLDGGALGAERHGLLAAADLGVRRARRAHGEVELVPGGVFGDGELEARRRAAGSDRRQRAASAAGQIARVDLEVIDGHAGRTTQRHERGPRAAGLHLLAPGEPHQGQRAERASEGGGGGHSHAHGGRVRGSPVGYSVPPVASTSPTTPAAASAPTATQNHGRA